MTATGRSPRRETDDAAVTSQRQAAPASNALREVLVKLMKERNIPGLQLAVVRDGRLEMLDTLGLANIEHQIPVDHRSVFSINSMAKAFTGIAVMQLVEDGKLDLDAPVGGYLDDLPDGWRGITIRQLATLTSGLPEIMVYTADSNVTLVGGGDEKKAWETAYASPMEYPTGQGYSYTQTNYALLGRAIHRISGNSF